MGKKVSQANLITSKNHEKKQQQLHSLIKVLRPKVYITDSSSFKNLVQELTGNRTTTCAITSPSPSPPYKPQTLLTPIDSQEDHGDVESSLATSFDCSLDSSINDSFEFCNNEVFNFVEEVQINESCKQTYFEDATSDDLLINQHGDTSRILACDQDFDHLLLDFEQQFLYSQEYQIQQEEVSVYDYELSDLI